MKLEKLPVKKGDFNLKDYDKMCSSFHWKDVKKEFSWHKTGKINIAYEAIDRHAESFRKNKIALYFRDGERKEQFTFLEMKEFTNKAANVLKEFAHVKKGDHVFVYMPRCPEAYFVILGTIKLGAIAGPLSEAFMEGALLERLGGSEAGILVTTSELLKRVSVEQIPSIKHIFVVGENVEENDKIIDFKKKFASAGKDLTVEWVDKSDGYIVHYTSGSTGKPKGILHVHNSMIQLYQTAKWVLDLKEDDIYWCTADPGWITGTSYGIFAPWLAGSTNVIVSGRFQPDYWYRIIEEYKVTVWYTAPAAFRMLMGAGDEIVKMFDLSSLRHILTVGEPLNPEIIHWGMNVFHCRIHDTWMMTETGGQMIANFPCLDIKPGSMGKPIPGVEVAILDYQGNELPPYEIGSLAIKRGWPSMMEDILNNKEQYESYFLNGEWYISGDSAYKDKDGYIWFQGRTDDVILTSGERIGAFEVESMLSEHPAVAEAGVIGKPDKLYGEIIKAYISLREGFEGTEELKENIRQFVKTNLASHAAPHEIEFCDKIPKTKSGKIIRRVLKSWEKDAVKKENLIK